MYLYSCAFLQAIKMFSVLKIDFVEIINFTIITHDNFYYNQTKWKDWYKYGYRLKQNKWRKTLKYRYVLQVVKKPFTDFKLLFVRTIIGHLFYIYASNFVCGVYRAITSMNLKNIISTEKAFEISAYRVRVDLENYFRNYVKLYLFSKWKYEKFIEKNVEYSMRNYFLMI